MKSPRIRLILLSIIALLITPYTIHAQSIQVNTLLFYSPYCSHCQKVKEEDLPLLIDRFGAQLNIVQVDVTTQEGRELYLSAVQKYAIPAERQGVPLMIIGTEYLLGSREIPERMPALVEQGLKSGGIELPDLPNIDRVSVYPAPVALANEQSATPTPLSTSAPEKPSSFVETPKTGMLAKFFLDPIANAIAVLVLVLMIISLIWSVYKFLTSTEPSKRRLPQWFILLFALLGMFVAAYMSYVEITESNAICGPLGNCNAVQRSPYASLFGFLPVGILGFFGYLAIGLTWFLLRSSSELWQKTGAYLGWGLCWFGLLFSIYLTFLEPFVIGATCAWCISSALIMTVLFLTTTDETLRVISSQVDLESDQQNQ